MSATPSTGSGVVPNHLGSAAYTPTNLHALRVTVAPEGRYAAPFRPYVYRAGRQSGVSRNGRQ